MSQYFKSGDVVRIKSGGPLMTVIGPIVNEFDADGSVLAYSCCWFVGQGKFRSGIFYQDTLEDG
jgi:uncharacterized protein YodC (DUF2158 family)